MPPPIVIFAPLYQNAEVAQWQSKGLISLRSRVQISPSAQLWTMKLSSYIWWSLAKEITMSVLKTQDQGTIVLDQQDYLLILIESFLIEKFLFA